MPTVSARAWCRADFAGGTLDIWPLGLLHPGARTVNLALSLRVTVSLEPRRGSYLVRQGNGSVEGRTPADLRAQPDGALVGVAAEHFDLPPLEAQLASESPRAAGLGASSAMVVALIAAAERLLGRTPSSPAACARLARDLEARLMGLPTGLQDHYPALLGGALEILHEPGGERVRPLDVDLVGLGRCLLVVDSGRSHFSAGNNWQIIRRRLENDPEVTGLLGGIAEVAALMPEALEAGDFRLAGELLNREWSYRRHLAAEISTPALEALLRIATSLGAWGGKACGAGGGGCLVLLCPPERRAEIAAQLDSSGGRVLATLPASGGLEVSEA